MRWQARVADNYKGPGLAGLQLWSRLNEGRHCHVEYKRSHEFWQTRYAKFAPNAVECQSGILWLL